MAAKWWRGRPLRVARLVLWLAVIMLLAGGALAYSCAAAASAAGGYRILTSDGGVKAYNAPGNGFLDGSLPPGQAVTAKAGE